MSFKREGVDCALYNTFKRRRIEELFEESIPEGEVLLTRNGRFACLVCHYRPLFDTAPMLAIHRKGKKHIVNHAEYVKKKEELQSLATKRQQLLQVSSIGADKKLGYRAAQVGPSTYSADIQVAVDDNHPRRHHVHADTQHADAVDVDDRKCDSISLLGKQVKDIIKEIKASSAQPLCVRPYKPKCERTGSLINYDDNIRKQRQEACSGTEQQKLVCDTRGYSSGYMRKDMSHPNCLPTRRDANACFPTGDYAAVADGTRQQTMSATCNLNLNTFRSVAVQNDVSADKLAKNSETGDLLLPTVARPDYKSSARSTEEYLRLRSSGWIRNSAGKWEKEDGVEFDSDEEGPSVEKA